MNSSIRTSAAISLGLSVVFLGLAQFLFVAMRPSLVRPLVFFLASASVIMFYLSLRVHHANRFVRLGAGLALAVEAVHLTFAILSLSTGLSPAMVTAANSNWILERLMLAFVIWAIRIVDGPENRSRFRIGASVAVVIAGFAVASTPVLFQARAVALIVFYASILTTAKVVAEPAEDRKASRLLVWTTGLFLLITLAASVWLCFSAYYRRPVRVWMTSPAIVVSAAREDDPRIADVFRAVDYWNRQLRLVKSPIRLGSIGRAVRLTADDRRNLRTENPPAETRARLDNLKSSIIIVLQDEPIKSFVHSDRVGSNVVVVISSPDGTTAQPYVMRNVIAHEIGHAIGLQHTDVPESLMCGAPAPCAVSRFESSRGQHFPLVTDDTDQLRRWYSRTATMRPR